MGYKFYSNITCPNSIEGTTTAVFDCDKYGAILVNGNERSTKS